MTDQKAPPAKPQNIEIIPPSKIEDELAIERPLQGLPIVNIARYWVIKRELERYRDALRARNDAMLEIDRGKAIWTKYRTETLTRLEHLDDLRTIEEEKIAEELAAAFQRVEDRNRKKEDEAEEHENAKLRRKLEKLELEIQLKEAERALRKADAEPVAPESELSPAQRVAREIARINREFKEIVDELTASAGGADQLDDEGKNLIESTELARRNHINELLEGI